MATPAVVAYTHMPVKPALWYRIAVGLAALNLVAGGFALGAVEPLHALGHGVLTVMFAFWARHLGRRKTTESAAPEPVEADDRLDALEGKLDRLRQELSEAQERLDFTERLLAQRPPAPRMGPER